MPTDASLRMAQARFNRRASTRGMALTTYYAGRFERDPATGEVAQAASQNASKNIKAITALKSVTSDWWQERERRWGRAFAADGCLLLPVDVPADGLWMLTDAQGEDYYVLGIPPLLFGEAVYRMVFFKNGMPFNKSVRVELEGKEGHSDFFTNLPARIASLSELAGQGGMGSVFPAVGPVADATPVLEIPNVYDPTGRLLTLSPKRMTVFDGLTKYALASPNQDPGGDGHHQRYKLSLDPAT